MKEILVKIRPKDLFGLFSSNVIVKAKLIYEDEDSYTGLAFFPSNLKYLDSNKKWRVDKGDCGSFSFVKKTLLKDCYTFLSSKNHNDYFINISRKNEKKLALI